jgi:hypothetical protein
MADYNPEKPYMVLMFVSPIEGESQIETIRNDLVRRGIGPLAVGAGIMRADQLEIFRISDGKIEVAPEPWVTIEEWNDHYKFVFLPSHPKERSGSWPTTYFGELGEMLPTSKVERNKDGSVARIDRATLRDFAAKEINPRTRRINAKKRSIYLQSFAATLQTKED